MQGCSDATEIRDYALIGDCHSAALVSSAASIDWCCMPRFDSASCFGRLMDAERGGQCSVRLSGDDQRHEAPAYLEDTLVLSSRLVCRAASVRVLDFFVMDAGDEREHRHEIVRIVECERGDATLALEIAPRFDYGAVLPWMRRHGTHSFTATGGDSALLIWSDCELGIDDRSLNGNVRLRAGQRMRLLMRFARPNLVDAERPPEPEEVDARLTETVEWWRTWRQDVRHDGPDQGSVIRSALTLKAMTYAPTGAIVAAPTTSLPEAPGADRNWDYRYSWIRDSALAARALTELGAVAEAEQFRHFVVRSSAGHVDELQIMFGIQGERRMPEQTLQLSGYRGSGPVRIGNGAAGQLQLDAYGEILNLAWRWHLRGRSPDDDEWRFLAEIVDAAATHWPEPDHGIWEWRGGSRQFVHSKACCWAALNWGLALADECARSAPVRRWTQARRELAEAIERHGYDQRRGVFVQCFDEPQLDASLLLLPAVGFVEYQDERMLRTADAIREELGVNGFIRRYHRDEQEGREGAFLACSFWLAECYARQARPADAREVFDRAMSAASPLGLFPEEVDPEGGMGLGNYPQALTHLSQIAAAVAIAELDSQTVGLMS